MSTEPRDLVFGSPERVGLIAPNGPSPAPPMSGAGQSARSTRDRLECAGSIGGWLSHT